MRRMLSLLNFGKIPISMYKHRILASAFAYGVVVHTRPQLQVCMYEYVPVCVARCSRDDIRTLYEE